MDPRAVFARRVLFPILCRRERNGIPDDLRDLERSQWFDAAALAALQLERLRALLVHAGAKSPFWGCRFAEAGFDPAAVSDLADLRRLPTLSKRDLQQHREELRTCEPGAGLVSDRTGGSTGEPVRFYLDRRRLHYRRAVALRHDRWTGWDIGDRTAYIWGHRGDVSGPTSRLARLRETHLERRIFLDTSSLSADRMEAFRHRLLAHDPALYVGYANAIYLFARFLKERGGRYHRPQAIITSAELLGADQRALIEDVFGCRVHDRYGSRETGLIASECGQGDAMHVASESILVEVLKADDTPAGPGEQGRIVVTDLLNLGMPLIRYEIRDTAEPVAGDCPCGRGLPRLRMTGGRVTDFLLARDGRIVSGASLTIYLIANAVGVAQAQLLQDRADEVRVRVVPGEGFGPDTVAWILAELPRYFGADMTFAVDEVSEIPLSASGKLRFSICNLDPAGFF